MKKIIIISILALVILISGCNNLNEVEKLYNIEFEISNNRLLVKDRNDTFYVSSKKSNEKFIHGKSIGVIVKDSKDNFSIEYDLSDVNDGITCMINGLNISKKLIMLNGETFELYPFDKSQSEALDLNSIFNSSCVDMLILNPENYEEFIDGEGNVYVIGKEVNEDNVGMYLYPVKLNGEDIFSITFDKTTMNILDIKDKIFMLKNREEADNIKTICYTGIYQYGEAFAVGIDNKYFELDKQGSQK